ncbi:hypothetical protein NQ318_013873 [Aromia moschata]|uniref:Vacuolar protein sorting-associated protein 13A n=1 Tax=Aromia moschata TaxID=1265417 RepID=A0AAV8Z8L1_9CUCU|nr:hypothetical protein NQ318_013873 [Aromia moschata]
MKFMVVGNLNGETYLALLQNKYELNLPIEVKAGTIGKVWLKIPWSSLWNQPIVLNMEDLHIVVGPVVTDDPFDPEKNKRLTRAAKKKALEDLDTESHILGGPSSFSEHLVSNILNYLQLNITNVHVRYEDARSWKTPLAAGLCIGSITAETTNSKWKPTKYDNHSDVCHYLIKIEAFSIYWNSDVKQKTWDLPCQYYQWRNAMSSSLQNYSINDEEFDFVLNPMTSKIKMVIHKSPAGNVTKLHTDVVVQDCNVQISKEQYDSLLAVANSMDRMLISWQFLSIRPKEKILENQKIWWRYASYALLEQRVKPYTWSRIRRVRQHYKDYMETYKQIILNPNDTELKLDLQKYEDNLSIINVVIARQQARLLVQARSISEKSFWSMLPSPERILLCEKIGFFENEQENKKSPIEHNYSFRLGNLGITLTNNTREILVTTLTQTICSIKPNYQDGSFKSSLKVEGIIIEGANSDDHLMPLISSEHLGDSPAFFFKAELEKMPKNSNCAYKLGVTMDAVECVYNKPSFEELETYLTTGNNPTENLLDYLKDVPAKLFSLVKKKLSEKWEFNLNIKMPYVVIPETSSYMKAEYLLVIDLGRYSVTTELCQKNCVAENATQMELEERLYSKLFINCADVQILFCDTCDNWKDARKEKDTDMHVIPKTSFLRPMPSPRPTLRQYRRKYKFSINLQTLKFNLSERKIGLLLKFFNVDQIKINIIQEDANPKIYSKDTISGKVTPRFLRKMQERITIADSYSKYKRYKTENGKIRRIKKEKSTRRSNQQNMNEAWARCVDLPGLEDNISPNNNINILFGFVINELSVVFSRSSDSNDRQYLMLRLGIFTMDIALMTYGPAYQISVNSILLTDKLHTTPSGQYLDLVFSPLPNNQDVITVLFRKVSASCPEFWTNFHGVETSLVANFGAISVLLHQEAVHTILKYSKYFSNKVKKQISPFLKIPPGSVKFSHSARLADLNVTVCDSDFDIVSIQLSGLEMDFLFRANERFVFRCFLSNINVEHLSDVTLYAKVLHTDEDKVFDIKYVRNATQLGHNNDISPNIEETFVDGSFKFHLGRINCTFLYKLIVQLQRFIANLEVLPLLEKSITRLHRWITAATETLKNNTKINLAINVCGPVFLIPQKSSSSNVMVIDTGELRVENFFKDYTTDITENILVKLNGVTVTRGVMTLTSTLEMQVRKTNKQNNNKLIGLGFQETLIEPISLNMDIKRYTNMRTSQRSWDIDSIIDSVQITLGQKDLTTIMAIYTDNIGEGKILDLFPDQIKSPTDLLEADETVRTLEAFFCEPKQKNIVAKCTIDEVQLMLFFDSGELLSSPIRDLNHGLCKLQIMEIDTSFVVYSDKSLDGKLSIDTVCIEEIGPDANAFDKIVLQSPVDDNKNNNCNITVNKPPIVDVTFHQNKTGDKSADVIIGRLSLSLSIPFCEKLALFVIECLPKDHLDAGIINPGYEAEIYHTVAQKLHSTSLTLSVRINKPELMFLVETTSNKKRYFITKSEILIDYSRHANRLNLVMSLSGLHSLFYDLSEYSDEPYVILKQCDIELCKSFSEESGEKITMAISSIYVKLCSEVVHSINDILNDIVEHFKVPEVENSGGRAPKPPEPEDLWEPKKLEEFIEKCESLEDAKTDNTITVHEILLVPKFDVVVIFELEQTQVLLVKSTIELTLYDWSSLLTCTCELTLQANYYNESVQSWEPLVDPIAIDEKEYKPWEMVIKVFQDKSLPMLDTAEHKAKTETNKKKKFSRSVTTTEDEDSGEDMMYLEPINSITNGNNRRVKTSLSTFLDDSDSENEDGTMEKLAAAISDLFTGDWNEQEDSDCDHSSDGDEEVEENEKQKEEHDMIFNKSFYVLFDAKETFNVTITPNVLKVINELITQYSNKIISVKSDKKSISLTNDIGPQTRVELYEKQNVSPEDRLLCIKKYENDDSAPGSPSRGLYFVPDYLDNNYDDKDSLTDEKKEDFELTYDFETLSSLQFPAETTSYLYDRINKNFMKIFVPNFMPIQTNCPRRNWEKLIRMHSVTPTQTYYLAAKHTIGKLGRNVVVSSPLQIKNETCFALSVLYQPSILQQLNLEPLGDVTNPFETTMRIAVLEALEEYNVPLYIAYHCKLFIQPAYAEGHYASDSGIWWQDLATELDTAYDLHCKPKPDSNVEIFSLRVLLKKNLDVKHFQAHTIPNYVIHLLPPLIIHNYLPYTLEVLNVGLKQVVKVEPGEQNSVYSLDFSRDEKLLIRVKRDSVTWSGNLNLTRHLDEKIIVLNTESKEDMKNLAINVKSDREGSCNLFFYTPYWIVNKTGLPLQIKAAASNSLHEIVNEDILLFTYKRHCKQTLNVRVYESNWSNEFGLECAGTTGLVVCKDNERKKKYLFFLSTRLSNMCPRLTKIVTLLPSFLVTNNTERALRFMEHNEKSDLWIDLPPYQTMIFWPETSSMQMYVKYRDSKLISQSFFISNQHRTVLRMDKGGAISIDVSGGINDSFRISFNEFKPGDAPVLVKNYCGDLFLKIQQQHLSPVTLLNPYHSLLYTWDDPTKPRQLVWNVYNNKGSGFSVDITKDGYGEERIRFHSVTPTSSVVESSSSDDSDSSDSLQTHLNKKVHKDKIVIYWLCYRDGLQRTLFLTQELRIYNNVLRSTFQERCHVECLVALSGVGLSIFTSENDSREHLYTSLCDTPAVWEVNVGQKWKTLTLELASWIEDKYRLHYKKCQLKEYVHIDFEKMFMLKPFFAELRRTYHPAVYLHFRKSRNYQYLNLRMQSFQVDNKQTGNIVLHPLPSQNLKELAPFAEVVVSRICSKEADIYRYVKFRLGSMYLNIENDLFVNLCRLLGKTKKFCDESTALYVSDITSIHKSVTARVNVNENTTRSIVEYLTLTNFGIQLNISNKIQMGIGSNNLPMHRFLDYLFPFNMSPYMPLEGVHHKISSIEHVDLSDKLCKSVSKLFEQVASQFLQQYYSHVLGLQVLVNTFAIQPAIEVGQFESERMASILLYGSRCLLGHINMSPAAVEACVVDIFANQNIENIQRIRRHGSYHKSEIVPKTITISSRNFTAGVPNALSQLIVNSQNAGINCDGEMFFRTTGKALLSLITRHPDEKSDSVEVARGGLEEGLDTGGAD